MNMQNVSPEEQRSTFIQFYNDLLIDGCIVQIGTLKTVELLPKDGSEVLAYIENHPGENLYFLGGVDPSREKQRASDEDVRFKNHFFLDFDVRIAAHDITDEEIKELGVFFGEQLSKHRLLNQWKYIVFSGNGIHIHYWGDPVEVASVKDWKEGVQQCALLAESHLDSAIDRKCTNVGRICRAPASYNNKNGHRKVEILLMQPEAKMDISHIEKLGRERQKVTGLKYQKAEIIEGDIQETSRNSTLMSLAGSLRSRGMDKMIILAAIREINKTRCKPPLDEEELEKIASNAAKYEPGKTQTSNDDDSWSVNIKPLSEYEAEEVNWLWEPRIAIGFLTLIEGDPDVGKSTLMQAIAKAVTLGEQLPADDAKHDPARVLMLVAEEGVSQIVRPKLEKMGADISKIDILESVKNDKGSERTFSLAQDLEHLEPALIKNNYRLLIVDPLNSYMGGKTNTDSEAEVRGVIDPFIKLAQKYDIAVVCIRHFGKSKRDKTLHRGLGSTAYSAIARASYAVEKNPLNMSERIMAKSKNNLAQDDVPAIAFEITGFGQFEWRGECNISLEELFCPPDREGEKYDSLLDEAKEFLRITLADAPKFGVDVMKMAIKEGISKSTLRRAREAICKTPRRDDKARSIWELAPDEFSEWTSCTSTNEPLTEDEKPKMTNMPNDICDEANDSTQAI